MLTLAFETSAKAGSAALWQDGKLLGEHLEHVYRQVPGGKERYWDQVVFDYHLEDYEIHVRPCTFSDIVEIDTFNELKRIDPNYAM